MNGRTQGSDALGQLLDERLELRRAGPLDAAKHRRRGAGEIRPVEHKHGMASWFATTSTLRGIRHGEQRRFW